ncbi:hypothetical protein DNU06_13310 [Putridiphycobacter roseus]|uniref:DUF2490 domain-containing protein n=1 Tax=Putridiphycobacter roseus TaxID=2219161 RepID=A0A2W1NDZ5_9FLAO|nr:DUF2490 domain-containing protein [Putridiphycobacter roseus]PZE16286.1 hypothetical protein DNU06_13310 [Putridiphycobacter roseus]
MIKHTCFICLLLISQYGHAQTQDANLWTGISVESKLLKNWSASIEAQSRFNHNISTLKSTFTEISTSYNLIKPFDIGIGYRISRKEKDPNFQIDNRLFITLKYKQPLFSNKDLTLKIRYKYQFDYNRLTAVNEYISPSYAMQHRFKYEISYAFKRIQPFIENEWLFDPYYANKNFFTVRISPGFSYKVNKKWQISFKYIQERNYQESLEKNHIYSFGVNYKLKGKLLK